LAATAEPNFLPLGCAHSSRTKKLRLRRPSHPLRVLRTASAVVPASSIAIEAAKGAGSEAKRRTDMATIGTFKKSANEYVGEIVTLSVQAKNVRIIPEEDRANDNAPSHRVFVGRAEIGAAWSKRSNEGRDYLSLKLDDPSFTAPIYANLFDDTVIEGEDSYSLIWSRSRRQSGD
jgi:uncharacterized protein (DUF736 family)